MTRWLSALLLGCLAGWPSFVHAQGWYGVDPARDGVYAKPYRYIGRVYTLWHDRPPRVGTGFLVGRSHVLTAGHVLYDQASRRAPYLVMFTPAEYYGRAPVGSANAVKWAVADPFLKGNSAYDYGVIKLNRPLGDRTLGWFTLQEWRHGAAYDVEIAGYTTSWNQGRSIVSGKGRVGASFTYPNLRWRSGTLSPAGGLSGSPAFFNSNGRWRVVGIYTSGEAIGGIQGVKLSSPVRRELLSWITANP